MIFSTRRLRSSPLFGLSSRALAASIALGSAGCGGAEGIGAQEDVDEVSSALGTSPTIGSLGARERGAPASEASDEFGASGATTPVHTFTANTCTAANKCLDVRPWIGVSACSGCSTTPQKQRFRFTSLEVGRNYSLVIYPAHSACVGGGSSTCTYSATLPTAAQGTLLEGAQKAYGSDGTAVSDDPWTIRFKANQAEVTVEVGHNTAGGPGIYKYLYVDYIDSDIFKAPLYLDDIAKAKDTKNGGDWWKDAVRKDDGNSYEWHETSVMDSYVSLYIATGKPEWLDKLADHADHVLAQRDDQPGVGRHDYQGESNPVWSINVFCTPQADGSCATGNVDASDERFLYPYAGFTGAVFMPLLRFARMIRQAPETVQNRLVSGQSLLSRATLFAQQFEQAMATHESEWCQAGAANGAGVVPQPGEGFYRFQSDMPIKDRDKTEPEACSPAFCSRTQPLPPNMLAFLAEASLEASKLYGLTGQTTLRDKHKGRAAKMATFMKNQLRCSPAVAPGAACTAPGHKYVWSYSTYLPRTEDIGHSNFELRFMVNSYISNLGVFDENDVSLLGQTFDGFTDADFNVPNNLVSGTESLGTLSRANYYWPYVLPYGDGLFEKNLGYVRKQTGENFFVTFVALSHTARLYR